jgi:hypothetical protein
MLPSATAAVIAPIAPARSPCSATELYRLTTPYAQDAPETKAHRHRIAIQCHLDGFLRQRLGLRVEQPRRRSRACAKRPFGAPGRIARIALAGFSVRLAPGAPSVIAQAVVIPIGKTACSACF